MRKPIGLAIAVSLPLALATPGGAVEEDTLQGRVKSKKAGTLTIQSRTGDEVRIRTDEGTTVRSVHGRLELEDVDAGDRVEVTASGRREPLLATEIRVEKPPRVDPKAGERMRQPMPGDRLEPEEPVDIRP